MHIQHVVWSLTYYVWNLESIYNECGTGNIILNCEKTYSDGEKINFHILGYLKLSEKSKNRFCFCVADLNGDVLFKSFDDYYDTKENPTGFRIINWGKIV